MRSKKNKGRRCTCGKKGRNLRYNRNRSKYNSTKHRIHIARPAYKRRYSPPPGTIKLDYKYYPTNYSRFKNLKFKNNKRKNKRYKIHQI